MSSIVLTRSLVVELSVALLAMQGSAKEYGFHPCDLHSLLLTPIIRELCLTSVSRSFSFQKVRQPIGLDSLDLLRCGVDVPARSCMVVHVRAKKAALEVFKLLDSVYHGCGLL